MRLDGFLMLTLILCLGIAAQAAPVIVQQPTEYPLDLQLFQAGGVIFGKGVLKNGLREQPATADGSLLEGTTMILNAVPLEDNNLYALSINIGSGNTTSGSFKLFTPGVDTPMTGSIYGGSNEPRGFSN